jgi:hypothetical protein
MQKYEARLGGLLDKALIPAHKRCARAELNMSPQTVHKYISTLRNESLPGRGQANRGKIRSSTTSCTPFAPRTPSASLVILLLIILY